MCFSWPAGVHDLTHLWHLPKAAEIPQDREQPRTDQCVHTTPQGLELLGLADSRERESVGPMISVSPFGNTQFLPL